MIEENTTKESTQLAVRVECTPAVITADWGGMRSALERLVEPYAGLDAEGVAELVAGEPKIAKAWRSDLKKMSNELNEARKAVKRDYNRPLSEFEAKCKELDALILAPWRLLDEAIKMAEEDARAIREGKLEEAYLEFAPALAEAVPFERLLEREWLNKSFGEARATDALLEKVTSVAKDWEAMKKMSFSFPQEAEAEFFRTLSLRQAVDYDARRAAEQERIERMKAEVAANRELAETPCVSVGEPARGAGKPSFEPVAVFLIAVEATVSQREGFVQYMRDAGLHGRVMSTCFSDADEAVRAVRRDVE